MSAAFWPSGGVSLVPRQDAPGAIVFAPALHHRILVHASRATWTACRDTGARHLRRAGDIDLVPAGETGGYDAETASAALEIRLATGLVDRVAAEMGQGRSTIEMRHVLRHDGIVHLARALDSGVPGGALYADTIGIALATQLIGLSTVVAPARAGLSPRQLQRVFEYVDAHIDGTLTLDVLAREAGASSAHLRHWFRQATGLTVHRYVMRRRVERAKALLLQGRMPPSEVAPAAGFAHQSHMARWMRRELGLTPRDFR